MASRLASFDEPGQAHARRYPWTEWADGSPWEIRRGEDYDVATESMRVNVHMKAKQLGRKARTRKFSDSDGEGLIFQFTGVDQEKRGASPTPRDDAANEALFADCCFIYETARQEVRFTRSDGTNQKYAAIRFMRKMSRAHSEGRLVAAASTMVEHRTEGFGRLEDAERDDLMLENFILDEGKPYHRLFDRRTVQVARDRMAEYYRHHPRRYGQQPEVSEPTRASRAAELRPSSRLGRLINKHRDEILAIAKQHKASNVRVFGSVARGDDEETSDIDLLVDLSPDADLVDLAELNVELGQLLGHPVDVVPARMLKPHVAPSALADAVAL